MDKLYLSLIGLNLSAPLYMIGIAFDIDFLGFSVSSIIVLMLVMLFDIVTGISASVHEHKKLGITKNIITSSKGMRSLYKIVVYILLVSALSVLEEMLIKNNMNYSYVINVSRMVIFVLTFLWEFQSIGENIARQFGSKPKIFNLLDYIAMAMEKFVKVSIGKLLKINDEKDTNAIKGEDQIPIQ